MSRPTRVGAQDLARRPGRLTISASDPTTTHIMDRVMSFTYFEPFVRSPRLLIIMALLGCEPGPMLVADDESDQGGGGLVIQLPLSKGSESQCTQGAYGAHSHNLPYTLLDIDLDTSNDADEEVYAPVAGVVRVHKESATSGFGYHVNIDRGDGTYVVIAHLFDIFVTDGQEVAEGTLIGYEGCTGECTGDHIHIGLHAGDAGETADQGESIPTTYSAADASEQDGITTIESEEFICGIRSEGDPSDGHFYESGLAVSLWHPDGALVKTPDNARVYLLEGGDLRWIENEDAFWSRNWSFDEVVRISDEELDCYGEGSDIAGTGFVDAIFDTEEELWLLVGMSDDSNRYRAPVRGTGWEAVMSSWGLAYNQSNWPDTHGDQSGYLTNWPPVEEYVGLRDGTLVKEEDASDVYAIANGYALPIETWNVYLLMNLFHRSILVVEDGVVGELHQVGSCATGQMCLDAVAVTTCGGGLDIMDGSSGSGGESWQDDEEEDGWSDSGEEEEEEETEEGVEGEEEEQTDDTSTLSIEVNYPADEPELTLTVQPIFSVLNLGDYWSASESVNEGDEVSWSDTADYTGLLGVRFNVNVDTDGDGSEDDWYCYGHYTTAFLEYGVAVDIKLDEDIWDEDDLVTWSPGSESQTELGCSALLWFGSTSMIAEGYVQ